MVNDKVETRIYEMVNMWNGRSWLSLKRSALTGNTSLNKRSGLNLDPEDFSELLAEVFAEFGLNLNDVDLSVYYPKLRNNEKSLTIDMLIDSAKAGRWLYE